MGAGLDQPGSFVTSRKPPFINVGEKDIQPPPGAPRPHLGVLLNGYFKSFSSDSFVNYYHYMNIVIMRLFHYFFIFT